MREKLYTIPLNDALNAHDECPFCFLEEKLEQELMDFVLGSGSSYMESDIRSQTDITGFCRGHFHKMFTYGNTLGNAWILKTHYQRTLKEMEEKMAAKASRGTFFDRHKGQPDRHPIGVWTAERESSCYICSAFSHDLNRYLDTFLALYKKEEEFRQKVLSSKGFCLTHFGALCDYAYSHLNPKQQEDFFPPLFELMRTNMNRVYEDVSWLIEKFDYQNKDADWKNSKDALQRGMQKLKGGYPAAPPYKQSK